MGGLAESTARFSSGSKGAGQAPIDSQGPGMKSTGMKSACQVLSPFNVQQGSQAPKALVAYQ